MPRLKKLEIGSDTINIPRATTKVVQSKKHPGEVTIYKNGTGLFRQSPTARREKYAFLRKRYGSKQARKMRDWRWSVIKRVKFKPR